MVALGALPTSVGGAAKVTVLLGLTLYNATAVKMDGSDNFMINGLVPAVNLFNEQPSDQGLHLQSNLIDSVLQLLL